LKDIPGVPVATGVYLLSAGQLAGALIGPIVNRFVSIRTMIIYGQFAIAFFNILVIVFQLLGWPIMILVSMVGVLTVY